MSSFNRRTALLSLTALAACGYTPLYAPGGSADGLRGAVLVAEPTTEDTFRLVAALEQRLGQPDAERYVLLYNLLVTLDAGGRLPNTALTRYTLRGSLTYSLVTATPATVGQARGTPPGPDAPVPTVVGDGTVTGFTNYSATLDTANIAAAAADARRRLMEILADKLVTELALIGL